jgi:predicted transcriptional regulator
MTNVQFQTLLRFFKALGDESRLKILGILASQECSVEELAVLLKLKEPTVSHHLAKLKELNLVSMRPEGNSHLYHLDSEVLQNISKEIFTPDNIASLVDDIDNEAWEKKVLRTYIQGYGDENESSVLLKDIPASRKKRLVILKWLANKFEVGVDYAERSVNDILRDYHPDFATLRRELVGSRLMERENGIYSRCKNIGQ